MFQAFDKAASEPPPTRAEWMALLSRSPLDLLELAVGTHCPTHPDWLRAPETGLMMVQGRVGATGERFNLGEITVTRCALRLAANVLGTDKPALVGVAYALGRSHRQAALAAVADALLQDPAQLHALEQTLLSPARQHLAHQRSQREQAAQSTKVEFFTVAREAGGPGHNEDEV